MNQSKQKLINYLDEYIDSEYFQKKVKKARKEVGVPLGGLLLNEKFGQEYLLKIMHDSIFVPEELLINNTKMSALFRLSLALEGLSKDFPIHNFLINSYFKIYLLFNVKFDEGLKTLAVGTNNNIQDASLCGVGEFTDIRKNSKNFRFLLKDYPVFIKISPYASQRDLMDFIKKNWPFVSFSLNRYKNNGVRLGKTRTKNEIIKKRNKLIVDNRELKIKEIVKIVNSNTDNPDEVVDEGLVGKILSIDRKRRK